MALLTLDEAKARCSERTQKILVTPHQLGVSEWNAIEIEKPDLARKMDATTRANLINNLVVDAVRVGIVDLDDKEVREIDSLGFFAVAFNSDTIVRFKHVGDRGPRNIATNAQVRLAYQQYDDDLMGALSLEGIPEPPTMLTCGYTLGFDGKLGRVSLQCDYAKHTLWKYVLWGDNNQGFGDYSTVPISPDLAPEQTIIRSTRKAREEEVDREAQ